MKFVRNGAVVKGLPPGFRFQPTDEELLFQYLKCKVFSSHLPASSIIPHINLYNYDPWDLPGNYYDEEERYLFSRREGKGKRMKRSTKCGYWKATGSDKRISSPMNSTVGIEGIRKTLVFYQGKSPNASKTNWVMHEYRLLTLQSTASNPNSQNCVNELGDWVLCRIFMKKRSIIEGDDNSSGHVPNNTVNKNVFDDEVALINKPRRFFDFMKLHNNSDHHQPPNHSSTSSTCSTSSHITEVSSLHHQQTSAYLHS